MTDKYYIGIDPGSKGAVAIIDDHDNITIYDMPTAEEFIHSVKDLLSIKTDNVVGIELVHPLPGQSCIASFTYGENNMLAKLIGLSYSSVPLLIPPQRWKKFYDLKRSKDETKTQFKRRSVDKALELYPSLRGKLRYSQDGRAEALLIAHYLKELDSETEK